MKELSLAEVDALALKAHLGQVDKIGVPYVEHVRAVSAGLTEFGPELQMAGLLHDVIEDTDWTAGMLLSAGVPDRVVRLVERVTRVSGQEYGDMIRAISGNREATLLKIADNAHNSREDRLAALPLEGRVRFRSKYKKARRDLWSGDIAMEIEKILRIVNPDLLDELY